MNRVEFATAGVDSETRSKVSGRYKRITRAVNGEFWGSQSEIEHTPQVGSYGRGTATSASDLDVLVSLPRAEYERYDAYRGQRPIAASPSRQGCGLRYLAED